jgi:uncharacterized membrane protein YgdD (TMEM256/DUF423 family)
MVPLWPASRTPEPRLTDMVKSERAWGVVAGLSGFSALVMGAIGAHAVADAHAASLVETASLYQLIHAGLLLWLSSRDRLASAIARWLFLAGTLLFCGTIYLKTLAGWESATALAPLGGTSFMLGWLLVAFAYGFEKRGS